MDDIRIKTLGMGQLSPDIKERKSENSAESEKSFFDTLKESIKKVNDLHIEADESVKDLVLNNKQDIHQTMIALEKADISFQLMMQVRNKIITAYEEIMRMQV
ncbi:MAG: flagellar hook-basal body complex protein FliE [Nitrospirota bacterium]